MLPEVPPDDVPDTLSFIFGTRVFPARGRKISDWVSKSTLETDVISLSSPSSREIFKFVETTGVSLHIIFNTSEPE